MIRCPNCVFAAFLAIVVGGVQGEEIPSVPKVSGGLTLLRVQLQDGQEWILGSALGRKDVGRPFAVALILANTGASPVAIWDPTNSEGATAPGIILADAKGGEIAMKAKPIARAAGIPSVWTLKTNEVRTVTLDLLRLVPNGGIRAGSYSVRGVFENRLANDKTFIKSPVWMGRIESDAVSITITGFRPIAYGGTAVKP